MIQALLKGKEAQSLYSEDCLTSNIFERLEYVEDGRLVGKFLGKADHKDKGSGRIQTLCEYIREKEHINILEFKCTKVFYWPRHMLEGEPDLAIILYNKHYNDGILFILEVKFKHSKSRVGDTDQLASYHRAVNHSIRMFNEKEISKFTGIIGPIIYLTVRLAYEEISDSENCIGKSLSVFSLRWHMLHTLLRESQQQRITNDITNYLDRLGLYSFSGIHIPSDVIDYKKLKWFNLKYFQFIIKSSVSPFYSK